MRTTRVSISVPVREEPAGIGWCVPACAQMVFAFHGERVGIAKIAKEMGVKRQGGIDAVKASMYFLRRGYHVRLVLWDAEFPPSFAGVRGAIPERRFMAWANRKVKDTSWLRLSCRWYGDEFFARGGKIETHATTVGMIRSALEMRQPPILFLNIGTLWKLRFKSLHAVVPVAVRDTSIVVNDPVPARKRTTYSIDAFLHAFYRCDGIAIFVRPKR